LLDRLAYGTSAYEKKISQDRGARTKRCEYWSKPENWEQLKDHNFLPNLEEKRKREKYRTLERYE